MPRFQVVARLPEGLASANSRHVVAAGAVRGTITLSPPDLALSADARRTLESDSCRCGAAGEGETGFRLYLSDTVELT